MGFFTDEMTRLHAETMAWRRERGRLAKNMAQARKEESTAVSEMLANFAFARAERAQKMKADFTSFMKNLRQRVCDQRRELREDMAGAHRAWCGLRASARRH